MKPRRRIAIHGVGYDAVATPAIHLHLKTKFVRGIKVQIFKVCACRRVGLPKSGGDAEICSLRPKTQSKLPLGCRSRTGCPAQIITIARDEARGGGDGVRRLHFAERHRLVVVRSAEHEHGEHKDTEPLEPLVLEEYSHTLWILAVDFFWGVGSIQLYL